jgi:hypothetical protein
MPHPLLKRLVLALGAPAAVAVVAAVTVGACGADDPSGPACARPAPTGAGGAASVTYCRVGSECGENVGVPGGVYCTAEGYSSLGGGGDRELIPPCQNDVDCARPSGAAGAAGGTTLSFVCEATRCRAACTDDSTCSGYQRCVVATGHCEARTCAVGDAPCPDGAFCAAAGTCAPKLCDPAVATSCAIGLSCDPTVFACAPRACSEDAGCPDTFRCEAGACARKSCACDTECGASGYCLKGTCAESLGTCQHLGVPGRPLLVASGPVVARLVASDAWG